MRFFYHTLTGPLYRSCAGLRSLLAVKTGVEIDKTGIVVTAVHETCPPDLLTREQSTYVPARVGMWRLRNLLNWKQPAICTPQRGQYRLHTGGAARENCTSMAPQMCPTQLRSGAVSPCRGRWFRRLTSRSMYA